MSELEKIFKNVLLGSVGAVATAVEKTGELAKNLVSKGAKVLEDNKDKTDAVKQKGKEALDGLGSRFNELLGRIRAQSADAAQDPAQALRDDATELDSLEMELRSVEELLNKAAEGEAPAEQSEPAGAEEQPAAEAPTLESAAENAAETAADALENLADKAASFLDSDQLRKAADHLTEEGDKLFRKVGEALDNAMKPRDLPDTESILQSLQRRLNDFGERLEASRKVLEDQDKPEDKDPGNG